MGVFLFLDTVSVGYGSSVDPVGGIHSVRRVCCGRDQRRDSGKKLVRRRRRFFLSLFFSRVGAVTAVTERGGERGRKKRRGRGREREREPW